MKTNFLTLLSLLAIVTCWPSADARAADDATPSTAHEISVTIDATKTGPPINPFIYGQFIEHLGRCIYGGIWAEMLEDRKFYYPVTDKYDPYRSLKDTKFPVVGASPWQVIGPAGSVTMDQRAPFVGEQSPQVAAGSGIHQNDLGLVAGKEYIGYVWLKSPARQCSASTSRSPGATAISDRQTDRHRGRRQRIQAVSVQVHSRRSNRPRPPEKFTLAAARA